MPLIDSIHGQKFIIEPQGGGDKDGFARGAWDWSMLWKRVPLGDEEKKFRKTKTEPYRYRKAMSTQKTNTFQLTWTNANDMPDIKTVNTLTNL